MKTELIFIASALVFGSLVEVAAQLSPRVRVSRDSLRHSEHAGVAKVVVVREVDLAQPATIQFTTRDASARAGQDYTAVSGSLQFATGVAESTLEVPLLDDTTLEGEETFEIVLQTQAGNGELRALDAAGLTIVDNERPVVVDPTFQPPADLEGATTVLEPDGKILVGRRNGRQLLRLNPDGSVHSKLTPPIVETNSIFVSLEPLGVDSSKRILLLRQHTFSTGFRRSDIIRLLPDGMSDPEWETSFRLGGQDAVVKTALALPDGKWMIGAVFDSWRGVQQTTLTRLMPNGSLDTSFTNLLRGPTTFGVAPGVYAMARQPDGKLIVSGYFNIVNNQTYLNIARLNEDGSPDLAFKGEVDASVQSMALQRDGRILIGGPFQFVNGVPQPGLARLNPDGSIDRQFRPKFDVNTFSVLGERILLQDDGKIWFSATFSRVNGVLRRGLVRLNADGSVDESFDPGGGLKTTSTLGISIANNLDESTPVEDPSSFGHAKRIWMVGNNRLMLGGYLGPGELWSGIFTSVDGVPRTGLARIFTDGRTRRGVRFSNATATVREGDGAAKLTIERLGDSAGPLSVDFSATVTRTNTRSSFTPQRGTVTFSPGETVKALSFPLSTDGVLDGEEMVSVELSSTDPAIVVGPPSKATLIIEDNERAVAQVDLEFGRKVELPPGHNYSSAFQTSPAVQSDGKILRIRQDPAAPDSSVRLVRLFRDGSLDPTFNAQLGTNDVPRYLAVRADGRIYVGGDIAGRNAVVRLRADGRIDPEFAANQFSPGALRAMAVQPDGKLLVGTQRTSTNNPAFVRRFNLDGTVDATFATNHVVFENTEQDQVSVLTVLPDGKIMVGGVFSRFNDLPRRGLVRLNADGGIDTSFDAGPIKSAEELWRNGEPGPIDPIIYDGNEEIQGNFGYVSSIAVQSDGRVIIVGWFELIQGVPRPRIARLHPNGSLDLTFNPGLGPRQNNEFLHPGTLNSPSPAFSLGYITSVGVATDDRIWVGGLFTRFDVSRRAGLARLNRDGTVDPSFAVEVGPVNFDQFPGGSRIPQRGTISNLTPLPDGGVLVGGHFIEFEFAPAPLGIVKIQPGASFNNTVEFLPIVNTTRESAGNTILKLRRHGDSSLATSVEVALKSGTASQGMDFTFATTRVNFAAFETEKLVTIPILEDGQVEGDEFLRFELRNPSPGTALGIAKEVELRLRDNETPASLDPSFVPSDQISIPYAVALQADGRVIVADVDDLHRLHVDGSIDPAFKVKLEPFPGRVNLIHAQPDGRILIAGSFTTVNGTTQPTLARLKPDGTLDDSFRPSGFGTETFLESVATQPDGKVLICGSFSIQGDGVTRQHLVRLNANGSLDPNFNVGNLNPEEAIRRIAIQPDGKILISGQFGRIQSHPRPGLARLNSDGSLDTTFQPQLPGTEGRAYPLLLLSDGKIVLGRNYNWGGDNRPTQVIRLHADGSLDSTFDSGEGPGFAPRVSIGQLPETWSPGEIHALAAAEGGAIWVAGRFTYWDGFPRSRIARLLSDGQLDHGFDLGTIDGESSEINWGNEPDFTISAIMPMGPDRLIVAGGFFSINNQWHPGLARLFANTSNRSAVTLEPGQPSHLELDGSVPLWLRRTGDTSRELVLNYVFQSGTTTAGEDFNSSSGTVRFGPLETRTSVSLTLRQDATAELDETVRLLLSPSVATPDLVLQESVDVIIMDNDRISSMDNSFVASFLDHSKRPPPIKSLEVQPDGKMLVLGDFTHVDGVPFNAMARLDSDGRFDSTFKNELSAQIEYNSPIALMPDGRIAMILKQERIGRVNSDGSFDSSFIAPRFGQSPNGLVALPDGKLFAFGWFSTVDGKSRQCLVRLNEDGSLDDGFGEKLTFSGPLSFDRPQLSSLSVQQNGGILIGGSFTAVNNVSRTSIARLDATGELDLTFNPRLGNAYVQGIVESPDGRILIHGFFSAVNTRPRPNLARLMPNGSLDESFNPGAGSAGGSVRSLVVQADGKVILSGNFSSFNGIARRGLVRLMADGSVDAAFDPGSGAVTAEKAIADAFIKLQPNGQLLLGGSIASYNGQPVSGLVRLHNDFVFQILSLEIMDTGAFRFTHTARSGQGYILEASENLQQWLPLSTNVATGPVAVMSDPDVAKNPKRFYRAVSR